jgi:tight adherence protein C
VSDQTITIQLIATGGAAILAVAALLLAVRSFRRNRAAKPNSDEAEPVGSKRRFARLGAVLRPGDDQAVAALQGRLARAGIYSRDAIDLYLSVRVSFAVGGLLVLLLSLQFVEGLVGAVVLFMVVAIVAIAGPSAWLDMRTKHRHAEISRGLPAYLDLLVTCLDAGLNLEQALARVSSETHHGDEILASEVRTTLDEMRAGLAIDLAFRRLAARVGHNEVQNLAALITQATALGANLSDALRDHAQTMRHHRIVFLEEQAGKANAKLTLPLTVCLLPSVMILLMGPAVLMILRSV